MKRMPSGITRLVVFVGIIACVTCLATLSRPAEPGVSKEAAALKSRTTAPKDAEVDRSVSIDGLLEKGHQGDWSTTKGAALDGYVIQVEKDPDGDVHLVLASNAGETNTMHWMIAEVTPFWQSKSPVLSEKSLRKLIGKKVKVVGWLFYDAAPEEEPRGTSWEIHPVTSVSKIE